MFTKHMGGPSIRQGSRKCCSVIALLRGNKDMWYNLKRGDFTGRWRKRKRWSKLNGEIQKVGEKRER